jgi:hypothetical protein
LGVPEIAYLGNPAAESLDPAEKRKNHNVAKGSEVRSLKTKFDS